MKPDTLEVIYEDNHVIAVNKPAGIAVQSAQKGEEDLLSVVRTYLKEKYAKQGNVFVGLVHRIDRPVSGVVVFAKTSKGASRLSEQIRTGIFKKTYEAVVRGIIEVKEQTLEHRLLKVPYRQGYRAIVDEQHGDACRLHHNVLEVDSLHNQTKIRINLETGRFHQIRAQLSAIGYPIVGDTLYGDTERLPSDAILLRAVEVVFNQPVTGEEICLPVSTIFFNH